MIYKHSQKKYPFARRKIRRGGLAKKGRRQGRKKSLCAFPTLRLCVNKKIRRGGPEMLRDRQQRKYPLCAKENPPRRTRKEGEPPRKVEIPLRLSYFAPLREQKSAAADPKCSGTGTGTAPLHDKKRMSRKEGEPPRKKEIPLWLCFSAPLREPTFYQKFNRKYRRDRLVPAKTIPVLPILHR